MGALQEEGIRFQLIGMSAAIVQGVEGTTQDVDLWVDLPSWQYLRPINVSRRVGAEMIRNTVVELEDGTLVNFVYEVTGLRRFATEYAQARRMEFQGLQIVVLPLKSHSAKQGRYRSAERPVALGVDQTGVARESPSQRSDPAWNEEEGQTRLNLAARHGFEP